MANEITEFIDVQISVEDRKVSQEGFGTIMILPDSDHSVFANRTKEYADLAAVVVDWATTTKVYKAAVAVFAQPIKVDKIKIGRTAAGDSDIADSLGLIDGEDSNWYGLITIDRTKTNILLAAVWIETKRKIYGCSNEDSDVLDGALDTDIASALQALTYHRTFYQYHHQSGLDLAGVAIVVASAVATVTEVAHTVKLGDPITVTGATPSELNGNFFVSEIVDDDNLKYLAPGAIDGAATGTIDIFVRYTFPEAAWMGRVFGAWAPGAATWKFQTLTGIVTIPTSLMTAAQKAAALAKSANVYVTVGSVGITQEGSMASSRFIDITRGVDWIEARMEENIFAQMANLAKIPFTDAGATIIENEIRAVLDEGITRNILRPLDDDPDNKPYTVVVPKVASVSSADRIARFLPDIAFVAQAASAIHKALVRGTISI